MCAALPAPRRRAPPHTASIGALSVARHRPHHGVRGRLLADPPPRGLLAAAGTLALISRLEVVLGHSHPAHSSITSNCHLFSTQDLLCMFTNIKCNKIYWITWIFCPNTIFSDTPVFRILIQIRCFFNFKLLVPKFFNVYPLTITFRIIVFFL